jgi:beta-lactam-binding protein with PASTA domain
VNGSHALHKHVSLWLLVSNYKTAETTLHNSKLNIRVLAHRYDPPVEPGKILFQTPQAGEFVDGGTFVGVTISRENPTTKSVFVERK